MRANLVPVSNAMEQPGARKAAKIGFGVIAIVLGTFLTVRTISSSRPQPLPPIFELIGGGDVQAIENAVKGDSNLIHAVDPDGNTPLEKAILLQQPKVVRVLLENGFDANAYGSMGMTPLATSTKVEGAVGLEIAQILVEFHADPLRPGADGRTPLHHLAATTQVNPQFFKLLAAKPGALQIVDRTGQTPRQVATRARNLAAVALLDR